MIGKRWSAPLADAVVDTHGVAGVLEPQRAGEAGELHAVAGGERLGGGDLDLGAARCAHDLHRLAAEHDELDAGGREPEQRA